jgi:mono/diheme cytochrome c family protein
MKQVDGAAVSSRLDAKSASPSQHKDTELDWCDMPALLPANRRDDQLTVITSQMRIRADLAGLEAHDVLGFLQRGNSRAPAYVSQAAGPVVNMAASAMSGKSLFDSVCVACHGSDGMGTIPGVPDL